MKKKFYATIQTTTLNVITIVIKAENKDQANELLKKKYKYKKVISLKLTAPTPKPTVHKESADSDNYRNNYINKSSRTMLFG